MLAHANNLFHSVIGKCNCAVNVSHSIIITVAIIEDLLAASAYLRATVADLC